MRLGLMKINGYLLIVVRVCSNQAHSKRGAFEQVFAKNTIYSRNSVKNIQFE